MGGTGIKTKAEFNEIEIKLDQLNVAVMIIST